MKGIKPTSACRRAHAEGSRVALGVGIGTFDGKTSAALGGSVRVHERVSIRASVSSSSGEVGAGLGVSF